jgi:hypothetical protein
LFSFFHPATTFFLFFYFLSPGDDFSKAPTFESFFRQVAQCPDTSPLIKLLFARLFDLIIGSITQMGPLVPCHSVLLRDVTVQAQA